MILLRRGDIGGVGAVSRRLIPTDKRSSLQTLRFIPSVKEKSCLILLPTYGCLESLSGQSGMLMRDRKSTRLNSSHSQISYAVFCLKKKKKNTILIQCPRAHKETKR